MVATDGGIFSFGDAKFFGSTGAIHLNKPIVGMASTPSGKGYWLVASDGGIFSFGDAKFFGSTGAIKLNKPIVGMTSSPSGAGYWMVASDGGIFSFGDAQFFGSTGSIKLAKPITGMAASPSGKGYWFTASDGGIFNYGDAKFFGAAASHPTKGAVSAMVPAPDGQGYWQASSAGELQAFGSALDFGGVPGTLARPVVGMTAMPAGATGVSTDPTGPGTTPTTGSTTPTTPTTPTTLPGTGLGGFSSTAKLTWGSPVDTAKTFTNRQGQVMTPYSQNVDATTEINNSVFFGGEFTGLVPPTDRTTPTPYGYIAELDTTNGAPVNGAFNATVKLDGPVRVLLRSADGHRLYVGGEFAHVNGEPRSRLVALDPATGQIDDSFNPPVPNAYVNSMALYGNTLYIGGGFDSLGGDITHPQLAALDAGTGTLNTGFTPPTRYTGAYFTHTGNPIDDPNCTDPNVPDPTTKAGQPNCPTTPVSDPNGVVDALAITSDGQYLLVGGNFLHFGTPYDPALSPSANHQRGGLIAVNPVTGSLTAWQPVSSRPVFGLNVWPGDGKRIFAAAGGAGGRVIAFVPGGQTKYLWVGNVDGDAVSVASTPTKVYLVGHYDHEVPDPNDPCLTTFTASGGISCPGGTPHRHLAAFDPNGQVDAKGKNNGKALTDPNFTAQADTSEGPNNVFIGAHQMYVGGNFSKTYACPAAPPSSCPFTKQPGFAIYPAL
jgi:hypothetical protein